MVGATQGPEHLPIVYGLWGGDGRVRVTHGSGRDEPTLDDEGWFRAKKCGTPEHDVREFALFEGADFVGNAVREGMTHDGALVAVTSGAADAFGIADRGRIAPGQLGNLVVWKGAVPELQDDPFDPSTGVVAVFLRGRSVDLETRQTELRDRYRTLPGTPAPLPLPATR